MRSMESFATGEQKSLAHVNCGAAELRRAVLTVGRLFRFHSGRYDPATGTCVPDVVTGPASTRASRFILDLRNLNLCKTDTGIDSVKIRSDIEEYREHKRFLR